MLLRQPGQAGSPGGRLATETARQGGQGDVLLLRQPGHPARGWPGGRLATETARQGGQGDVLLLRQPGMAGQGTSCY